LKKNISKMSNGFKILRYNESEHLKEDGSNWTFWRTHITPYLKGLRLWPYISGTMPRPRYTDVNKLAKWEEIDTQALSMILMNIAPNVQAGLNCSSAKATWDGLLICYVQADPIAQNLAQTRLSTNTMLKEVQNLTGSHCGAPEIEGSQQRTRHRCHRHPCCKDVNESVSVGSGP